MENGNWKVFEQNLNGEPMYAVYRVNHAKRREFVSGYLSNRDRAYGIKKKLNEMEKKDEKN